MAHCVQDVAFSGPVLPNQKVDIVEIENAVLDGSEIVDLDSRDAHIHPVPGKGR